MKITVLGAGGAFAPLSRGNSSFLVEHQNRVILIDCGTTVPYVLRDELSALLQQVTDVIVTHCHADHIGGLEQVLYACKYMPESRGTPNIWAAKPVMNELFCALRPGMGWAQDGSALDVTAFFNDCSDLQHLARETLGLELQFFEAKHVGNMPAYGCLLGRLFVSGDANEPMIGPEWRESGDDLPGLIFHEAEFGFATGVHCPVGRLDEVLDHEMKSRTWLYHCPAGAEKPDGFAGVLDKGMTFEL